MADNKIKKLAELSGVSEATVKRALGNYRGISSTTKQKILDIAKRMDYGFKTKRTDVGIVIPSAPAYFWKKLSDGLLDCIQKTNLNYRCFVFSDIANEEDALFCIDKAINSEISVLIISAPGTERVRKRIEKISKQICVILLEEYIEIENTCFVGEDMYRAGKTLAQLYFEKYKDSKLVVIFNKNINCLGRRAEGFVAGLKECEIASFLYVENTKKSYTKGRASVIARELKRYAEIADCVCCTGGGISEVNAALDKINPKKDIHIIGFENNVKGSSCKGIERVKLIIDQDLKKQAETAVEIADTYIKTGVKPEKRNVFVKSKVLVKNGF